MLLFLFLLLMLPLHRPLPFLIIRSDRAAKPRPVPHSHTHTHPPHTSLYSCTRWSFVVPQFWPQFNFLVMHMAEPPLQQRFCSLGTHTRGQPSMSSIHPPAAASSSLPKMLVILQQLQLRCQLQRRPQCNQRNRWNRLKSVRVRCIYRRFV